MTHSKELLLSSPRLRLSAIDAEIRQRKRNRISQYYCDEGPLRRGLYGKHLEFFKAGAQYRERLFLAGNRTGKSTMAAYECTCHMTGRYPGWWEGKRFDQPIKCWVAGESGKKVREVVQEKLFGPPHALGTDMLPADCIVAKSMKSGVPDGIDIARIQHISGGHSQLTLKSYEQGRVGFDGDVISVIWLDEEATTAIYTECLLRTLTTNGMVMLTFTPLQGLSELVQLFLPGGSLTQDCSLSVIPCRYPFWETRKEGPWHEQLRNSRGALESQITSAWE